MTYALHGPASSRVNPMAEFRRQSLLASWAGPLQVAMVTSRGSELMGVGI